MTIRGKSYLVGFNESVTGVTKTKNNLVIVRAWSPDEAKKYAILKVKRLSGVQLSEANIESVTGGRA